MPCYFLHRKREAPVAFARALHSSDSLCDDPLNFGGVTLAAASRRHKQHAVSLRTQIASMADTSDNTSDADDVLPCELYPEFQVRCALFEGVANATELVAQCVKGEIPGDLALIDADRVVSTRALRQASMNCARRAENKAAGREYAVKSHDLPRGRTTGADLVYALAPSTSMGGAFRDVGASDATTRLLVCAVSSSAEEFRELVERVDGRRVPLSALDARSDAAHEVLVKRFGLSADERRDVERAVLTRLATKDLLKGGGG